MRPALVGPRCDIHPCTSDERGVVAGRRLARNLGQRMLKLRVGEEEQEASSLLGGDPVAPASRRQSRGRPALGYR